MDHPVCMCVSSTELDEIERWLIVFWPALPGRDISQVWLVALQERVILLNKFSQY